MKEINSVEEVGKGALKAMLIAFIAVVILAMTSCSATLNVPSSNYSDRSNHNYAFHQWRKHHQCDSYR